MTSEHELLEHAEHLIARSTTGILATADDEGRPWMRWMTGVLSSGRPWQLFTLSSARTRKVGHIRANPCVSWLFSDPDRETVVTLRGRAEVEGSPLAVQQVWDRLSRMAERTDLSSLCWDDAGGTVAITSRIERLELVSVAAGLTEPRCMTFPADGGEPAFAASEDAG